MKSPNCPRALKCSLELRREDQQLNGILVFAFSDQAYSVDELADAVLSGNEAAYFSTLRHPVRQMSYLLGRYAAKLALSELFSEQDFRAIEIMRGVFEQPTVQYVRNPGYGVTISHSGSVAVALAYPAGHPMGVDIERHDPSRYQTILSQLTANEAALVEARLYDKSEMATGIWTAKEALAKVLTTGLMTPFHIYELAEVRLIGRENWEGLFQNFAQYKVCVWLGSAYGFAVVSPRRTAIVLKDDLRPILMSS